MTVVVTGASGFVGSAVMRQLGSRGRALSLRTPQGQWAAVLQGADCVVHLAARAHIMHDRVADPLAAYREINTVATLHLARMAAQAGVRRFVFMSSVKVSGERSQPGQPLFELQTPAPEDAYGISKWEAEQALREIGRETAMEVVIIRPPLVYGPGVRANFAQLIRWVARGVPLPLAGVDNRRSLVALDNLVDFVDCCLRHPAAANATFMVSDGDDVSTPNLIRRIAQAQGRSARLFHVAPQWLRLAGQLTGKSTAVERLCGSLQVDISKARTVLGWFPRVSMPEALRATVATVAP